MTHLILVAYILWVTTLRVWTPPLRVQITMTSISPTNRLSYRKPNKWVNAGCVIYSPWFLNLTVLKEFTRYISWWEGLGTDRYEPISRVIIWSSADWAGRQVVGSLVLLCVIPTLFTLIDMQLSSVKIPCSIVIFVSFRSNEKFPRLSIADTTSKMTLILGLATSNCTSATTLPGLEDNDRVSNLKSPWFWFLKSDCRKSV